MSKPNNFQRYKVSRNDKLPTRLVAATIEQAIHSIQVGHSPGCLPGILFAYLI
jgi:hypothetical protein